LKTYLLSPFLEDATVDDLVTHVKQARDAEIFPGGRDAAS
jgi:hypothetical protein